MFPVTFIFREHSIAEYVNEGAGASGDCYPMHSPLLFIL